MFEVSSSPLGLAAGIGILIILFLFAWFVHHPAHERRRGCATSTEGPFGGL
jgi:hypothetical protein